MRFFAVAALMAIALCGCAGVEETATCKLLKAEPDYFARNYSSIEHEKIQFRCKQIGVPL